MAGKNWDWDGMQKYFLMDRKSTYFFQDFGKPLLFEILLGVWKLIIFKKKVIYPVPNLGIAGILDASLNFWLNFFFDGLKNSSRAILGVRFPKLIPFMGIGIDFELPISNKLFSEAWIDWYPDDF